MKAVFLGFCLILTTSGCSAVGQAVDIYAANSSSSSLFKQSLQAVADSPEYQARKNAKLAAEQQTTTVQATNIQIDSNSKITPNAYGLGVNSDQYGRPTQYEVIGQPKADTSLLDVKQDAYGSGVGMDQYGRPVKNVPLK